MKLARIIVAVGERNQLYDIDIRKDQFPPIELREGNFSVMSVCLFRGGVTHVAITRDALDLTVQGPLAPPIPRYETSLYMDPLTHGADIWWLLS